VSNDPRIIELTIGDDAPNDRACAAIASAIGDALYGAGTKSARVDPNAPGAYVCRDGDGVRVFILGRFYQVASDCVIPEWVKPWLEHRFGAKIHGEARTDVEALREVADMRARELLDVWRIVGNGPVVGEVPMVLTAVRLMRERHDSYKASATRLSDETVGLRAEVKRLKAEMIDRKAKRCRDCNGFGTGAMRGMHCETCGGSGAVIVEAP
jgi:hypothetical protein